MATAHVSPAVAATPGSGGIARQDTVVRDQASLIAALRDHCLTVTIGEPAGQEFLRTPGTVLYLSGGRLAQPATVQTYEYADTATAAADSARLLPNGDANWIEADGTGRLIKYEWIAPPHLYRSERLLVLYVGADPVLLDLLASLLGSPLVGQEHHRILGAG